MKEGVSRRALFLDRDGVINERIPDDYVKKPEEFHFIEGALPALAKLSQLFDPVIVVTNQQGIGRGLMTMAQLEAVHEKMIAEILQNGGRIDAVYVSPDLKNTRSFTRKPAVGMGLKAARQFPQIEFRQSFMAGDTYSDILFGRRLGMKTVLIGDDPKQRFACSEILDYSFSSLHELARNIEALILSK